MKLVMKFSPLPSFLEEGIKLISFCPLCQSKQSAMEVNVLEQTGENHLIHLRCQNCQTAILVLVTLTPLGLNSVGMITDLSVIDAKKFKEAESLEYDEIIDLPLLFKDQLQFFLALESVNSKEAAPRV